MGSESAAVVNEAGLRQDERGCDQLRPDVYMTTDVLSRANGSAYLEIGNTKVTVAVDGPRPVQGRQAYSERGVVQVTIEYTSFSQKGTKHTKKWDEQSIAEALGSALLLEQYPKAVISVLISVLEADGNEVAAFIMAAGMALCNAGLEMRSALTAAGVITVGRHVLVDPTLDEERVADREVLVAMDLSCRKIAQVAVIGAFSAADLKECIQLAASGCATYAALVRQALVNAMDDDGSAMQAA